MAILIFQCDHAYHRHHHPYPSTHPPQIHRSNLKHVVQCAHGEMSEHIVILWYIRELVYPSQTKIYSTLVTIQRSTLSAPTRTPATNSAHISRHIRLLDDSMRVHNRVLFPLPSHISFNSYRSHLESAAHERHAVPKFSNLELDLLPLTQFASSLYLCELLAP